MHPGEHFKNILQLRVKKAFIFLCLFQTLSIVSFTLSKGYPFLHIVAAGSFFTLKVTNHYFGYLKIKYRDDGRDYVSAKEFLAIHCTFSLLHAWFSYCLYFSIFVMIHKIFVSLPGFNMLSLESYGRVSLFLLLIEMAIYLAYFKDLIYALTTLVIYCGVFTSNFLGIFVKLSNDLPYLIGLTSILIAITLLLDYRSAFYLNYDKNLSESRFNKWVHKALDV